MSQYDFGDLSSPLPGATFINTHLEPWRDALHSLHSGSSRPSYAVAGTMWIDNTTTPWILKVFNGTADDVTIGTINATTLVFSPAGVTNWAGSAGGTANAITLTPSPAWDAYNAGDAIEFLVTADNTTEAPTINVSGLGTQSAKCSVGGGKVNLPKGGFQSGMIARAVYDGTDFIILNLRPNNKSADIATASNLNLNNASGDYVDLTGTTTVTQITLDEGVQKLCQCDASFTIQDGSGSSPLTNVIINPGGTDIVTRAGDCFLVRGEADGVARIIAFFPADEFATPLKVNAIGSIGGGTQDIDLSAGRIVTGTVDTSTTTFTFSNPVATGLGDGFFMILTNGGSQTVNWPASVDWPGGSAPSLTAAGVDILLFKTIDGGTTWYGASLLDYS